MITINKNSFQVEEFRRVRALAESCLYELTPKDVDLLINALSQSTPNVVSEALRFTGWLADSRLLTFQHRDALIRQVAIVEGAPELVNLSGEVAIKLSITGGLSEKESLLLDEAHLSALVNKSN